MIAAIDAAKAAGDTLGGQFVVRVDGMPVGIGSNRQPNQRLDGILAGALMGMQTVKAVEIGLGAGVAATPGSQAHDVFALEGEDVVRKSNRAGGIEGGMSNGEPIVVRVSVKPIPTLMKALPSVNLHAGHGRSGDDRAQRRLRRSGGRDRRRGDGAARADGAGAGEVWRRLDGRDAGQPAPQPRGCRTALCARPMKRHVALVGFMAIRKIDDRTKARTAAGLRVCRYRRLVAREHGPVPAIFAQEGEAAFRRYEQAAIRGALDSAEPAVLALGGGALTAATNRSLLAARAYRVFIRVSPEQVLARLRKAKEMRPLLGSTPTLARYGHCTPSACRSTRPRTTSSGPIA